MSGVPPQDGPYGPYPAYGYGPPVGRPPRSGIATWLIITGAAVLVLIMLGVIGGVLLLGRQPPRSPGVEPSAEATAVAPKASDAVRSYLEALAAGDAEGALALSADVPADRTFLTASVLRQSVQRGAITAVDVPTVDDPDAHRVTARYRIGARTVHQEFAVQKAGDRWQVSGAWVMPNLSAVRHRDLPMVINGVAVTTNRVLLFPGTYAFTTGNPWVDYGRRSTIVITAPRDSSGVAHLKPTLTAAGHTEVIKKTRSGLHACLQQRSLAPSGCPNQVRAGSSQSVQRRTIRWALKENPWGAFEVRLESDRPTRVRTPLCLIFSLTAGGTQDGHRVTFEDHHVNATLNHLDADLSGAAVEVRFSR